MKPIQFIYTTRHGTFYHLTPTNLNPLDIQHALVSLGDFVHMEKILNKLKVQGISFKKYLGFDKAEKMCTYLTSVDSYKPRCIEGSHLQMTVKLFQNDGFRLFNIDQYNKIAELIESDILVSLTETPPDNEEAGLKSNKRAVEKSLFFLENSLQYFKEKQNKPQIYASIQGGLNPELRSLAVFYSLQTCFKDQVPIYDNFGGLTFHGFTKNQDWYEKDLTLTTALKEIPEEIRSNISLVLAGKGDILQILWGVSLGLDKFEVEEPFTLAEQSTAILIPFKQLEQCPDLEKYQNDQLNFFEFQGILIPTLKFPLKDELNEPIDKNCECFTCKNHSQVYISHLVLCKEMNASILLSIHNTTVYQKLQKEITEQQKQQKLNAWIRCFLNILQ